MASCPTEEVEEAGLGSPTPSGAYTVLRYGAPVAVCTLNDEALASTVARTRLSEVGIIGTLHTENLGIERLISNVIANPNIRFVVVCGADSHQAIGHLPGQSLVALGQSGINAHQRIIGAKGKRPILRNLDAAAIGHFRRTAEVVDLVGISDLEAIIKSVRSCAGRNPVLHHPFPGAVPSSQWPAAFQCGWSPILQATSSSSPIVTRGLISLEHYANNGVLTTIIEGRAAAELYMTAIDCNLLSRLDHAAYLGPNWRVRSTPFPPASTMCRTQRRNSSTPGIVAVRLVETIPRPDSASRLAVAVTVNFRTNAANTLIRRLRSPTAGVQSRRPLSSRHAAR